MVAAGDTHAPAARARGRAFDYIVFSLVLAAVAVPAMFLVLGSFSLAHYPSDFSIRALTLANHIKVWSDPGTYAVLANTLIFAIGSTFVGLGFAALLAFLVERSDLPGKTLVYACVPITLAIPGMLQAMAWVLLASPRVGFLNKALADALGLTSPVFNIYSLSGMIFVEGLRTVPTAFLMLTPLMRAMDPSLEEAAEMAGALPRVALRRVTLALLAAGLVAVAIYQFTSALEEFEVAGILGMPANIFVFSTKIYNALRVSNTSAPDYGAANALGLVYLVIAAVAVALYGGVLARAARYGVITGKAYRPSPRALGVWRWPAAIVAYAYLVLAVALPFVVLVYVSLLSFVQAPSARAFAAMNVKNYTSLWGDEDLVATLYNTTLVILVVAAATVAMSFAISLVVVRSDFRWRRALDQLAFMPHAIPGMVMGLALFWLFLQVDKLGANLFGSLASVMIAFVIGYISYGTRVMNSAILQVNRDLEEAASMSGAATWRVHARILLPLMRPAFLAIFVWTLLHVSRSAGKPLILASGGDNTVLAVAIWNRWDQGDINQVGAIGVLLMTALFAIAFIARGWSTAARN